MNDLVNECSVFFKRVNMAAVSWNDQQAIYKQLKEKVVELIIDQEVLEGEAVPSVRQVAADYQINPLTVSKAYQELVNESILEARRGLGMFVKENARKTLLETEKNNSIQFEWPKILEKIKRLGLSMQALTKKKPAKISK